MAAKTTYTYKTIWGIAWPLVIGNMAQNLITTVDTMFLSRLGEVAAGASAIAGLMYFVIVVGLMGFANGLQIIMARRFGEQRNYAVGKAFFHALCFVVPFITIAFYLLYGHTHTILSLYIRSEAIRSASVEFLRFRLWGLFFVMFTFLIRSFLIGIGETKLITVSTIIMSIANIILAYGFIFGGLGFPAWGIGGAAFANVIAEGIGLACYIFYLLQKGTHKQFALLSRRKFSMSEMNYILKISLPLMVQAFFSVLVWYVFFIFVEKMGQHELAVSNIVRSLYGILMIPVFSMGSAVNSLVSRSIGEGHKAMCLPIVHKTFRLSAMLVLIITLPVFVFGRDLLSLYTNDPRLLTDSLTLLRVISFAALGFSFAIVVFNGVAGLGKTMLALIFESSVLVVYLFYSYAAAIPLRLSIEWVWLSEYIYAILLGAVSYGYLVWWTGRRKKTQSKGISS